MERIEKEVGRGGGCSSFLSDPLRGNPMGGSCSLSTHLVGGVGSDWHMYLWGSIYQGRIIWYEVKLAEQVYKQEFKKIKGNVQIIL